MILFFGSTSKVYKSLKKSLECISVGRENADIQIGDIEKLYNLSDVDLIINAIYLKNMGCDENIKFLDDLNRLALHLGVKKIIHFSSIAVYLPFSEYAQLKLATDIHAEKLGFSVIRMGHFMDVDDRQLTIKIGPINILKGFGKTSLHILEKNTLLNYIKSDCIESRNLFTQNSFRRDLVENAIVLPLPKYTYNFLKYFIPMEKYLSYYHLLNSTMI